MLKDFAGWHIRKQQIDVLQKIQFFHEREIWWTAIGHNIGSEENGKGKEYARPVLVLHKFNLSFFFGVPLSTTRKTGNYYHALDLQGAHSTALLSQLRAFDARRLRNKLTVLEAKDFQIVQKKLAQIISTPASH